MRVLLLIAVLLAPLAAGDANVTVEHHGGMSLALAELTDLGCDGHADLEITGAAVQFQHHNGTSCAEARLHVPLPSGANSLRAELFHIRHAGEGLLSTSLGVDGTDQAVPLSAAHVGDRENTSVAEFEVSGDSATLVWRFDASGEGGSVSIQQLYVAIRGIPVSTPDLSRDSRLDGDFVDDRQLAVHVLADPVAGLRPAVHIDLDDTALIRAVIAPDGARLDIDGDGDRLTIPAPLVELHGTGDYMVLYRTPSPVAAQGSLVLWFAIVMMTVIATTGLAGYLVTRHWMVKGRSRIVSATAFAVLLLGTAIALSRTLLGGDLRTMVESPLSAVATTQYVILGVLAVGHGILAGILGGRQARFLAQRLRARAKRAEDLEEQQEQLETFTAAAAHDLRAPLRAIAGNVSLAKRSLKSKPLEADRLLDRAVQGTKRMDELVTALLDHSQVTNATPEPVEFDLGTAAKQAKADLATVIRERAADVDVEGDATMKGDPRLVRQAIQNLVQNGIKYSDDPWVRVRISQDEQGTSVQVVDRGRGIPEGEQQSVLQAFQRGSNGRDKDGTGLGLATVCRIMDLHDGEITVQSVMGQGTTFTLWFPIDPIDDVLLADGTSAARLNVA